MAIIFPTFQSIVFNQKAECNRCDTFYYNKEKDLQFQFNSKFNLINETDFEKTPYPVIPTGGTWEIDIPPLPYGLLSPIRSAFLLQNNLRTRMYVIVDDLDLNPYNSLYNNAALGVRVIRIKYSPIAATMRTHIRLALEGFCLETGTTAVDAGTGVKIENMPANIGFVYWNMNANINTPNPDDYQMKHFIDNLVYSPITKKMYWLNMSRYYKNAWEGNGSYLTVNEVDLRGQEGKLVNVKLKYENTNTFNLRIRVALKDNGWFLGTSQWYDMPANSSGEIVHTRTVPTGYSGGNLPFDEFGQIELIIDDNGAALLRDAPELSFWIDDITIETKNLISKIEKKICDSSIEELDFTISEINDNNLIILEATEIEGAVQIIVTDTTGNVFMSNMFNLIEVNNNCLELIRVTWYNNCVFDVVDYKSLPFENEFYIKAYLVSTDINETNSIYYKNSKGKEFNIFGISAEQYELRIAPYTKVLHTIMARAMMHQNIMIDGERYYKNESSKYTKANIENGFYTARIQLTKEGTEIVSTLCC